MDNPITKLFNIEYPIIQAGMVWCAPWELASAVSNAGGLGIIGAASMYPDVLKTHIGRCKEATSKPFAVNVPLMYPDIDKLMDIIISEEVPIVFTSAGNPATWTPVLKEKGIKVSHVVPGIKFTQKAEASGVDCIVAEGFEAGGHNGRDETTTFVLIPMVREATSLPLLAAGGIATGKAMLAAMALGADGVQIGTRFAASRESSAHQNFKDKITEIGEGQTQLSMKKLIPVRMIKNKFYEQIKDAENRGASEEDLKEILGRARAKLGMFEGDLNEGELEIGQVSGAIHEIKPAATIVEEIWAEYQSALKELKTP